jgi:hypothetical protein
MHALKKQRGMTGIGWLIVLALIGFFVLLTLRMAPSYMEYYKIVSSLESLESEDAFSSAQEIRNLLERRFDISYVDSITFRDVKIRSAGSHWLVTASYDSRKHIFGNVDVVMNFEKQVQVRKF